MNVMIGGAATLLLFLLIGFWAGVPNEIQLLAKIVSYTGGSLYILYLSFHVSNQFNVQGANLVWSRSTALYVIALAIVMAMLPQPKFSPADLVRATEKFERIGSQKSNWFLYVQAEGKDRHYRLQSEFAERFKSVDPSTELSLLLHNHYVAEARTPETVVFSLEEYEANHRSLGLVVAISLLAGVSLYWAASEKTDRRMTRLK